MLHGFLEAKTLYKDWIKRKIEYGFIENEDFVLVTQKRATNTHKNPETEIIDHALKIYMAKEISILQRNDKGKQARQYFIQVEKLSFKTYVKLLISLNILIYLKLVLIGN